MSTKGSGNETSWNNETLSYILREKAEVEEVLVEAESTVIQWGAPSSSEQDRLWSRWPHPVCSVSSGKTMQPFHSSLTFSLLKSYQQAKSWILSIQTTFGNPTSPFYTIYLSPWSCYCNTMWTILYHVNIALQAVSKHQYFNSPISLKMPRARCNAWSHVNGMR